MQDESVRFRVLGCMLEDLCGKKVCLLGTVVSVAPDGCKLKMKSCDDKLVDVKLGCPLQTSPDSCIVEVQGTVADKGGDLLEANDPPLIYSKEASANFDMELYCKALQLTASCDQFYVQPM